MCIRDRDDGEGQRLNRRNGDDQHAADGEGDVRADVGNQRQHCRHAGDGYGVGDAEDQLSLIHI